MLETRPLVLITAGSRGDIQPFIALALGLRRAGHRVRLAANASFRGWVESFGLEFAPLRGDAREVMESPEGQRLLASGASLTFARRLSALIAPHVVQFLEDSWAASQDARALVFSQIGFYSAYAIAEKLRTPAVAAYLMPFHPTGELPAPMFRSPPAWLPGRRAFNRLGHLASSYGFWNLVRSAMNAGRAKLGLPPQGLRGPYPKMNRGDFPVVYGFSEHVVPKPKDWGGWIELTGYWFVDTPSDYQPPAELRAFLEAGPPPVCVGFGSMKSGDPGETTKLMLQALEQSGQRGVLLGGWGGLARAELPPTVVRVDEIPHDWLLPRVAAAVHHGGAGTTAAALRAGVPSVVVPFYADQPFWGARVRALGVGPEPIPRKKLTAGALANALRTATTDARMRARAEELARRLREERGVERAVEAVERTLALSARTAEGAHPGVRPR